MTEDIKRRIEQIIVDQVPEGYTAFGGYIIPAEWEIKKLEDCFSRLTRKNLEENQNVLTISAQQGLISQLEYYSNSYASEDKCGYSLLHKGDYSYNKSYSADYPYGAIKRLEKYNNGIVSPLYICFEPKDSTNSDYYIQYFEAGMFNREIYKIAQEGARNHGLLNVSVDDFFSSVLVSPSIPEQQKIAEILMQCDKVIELKKARIEEEKKRKKWLMDKLLKPVEESGPSLKISSVTDYIDYRGKTPKKTQRGVLLLTARNIKMGYIDYSISREYVSDDDYETVMQRGKPRIGDVLITTEAPCGNVAQVNNSNIALAQRVILLRAKSAITNDYLCLYLQSSGFQSKLQKLATGLTAQGIKGETFHNMEIPVPPIAEQNRICKMLCTQNFLVMALEDDMLQWQKKKKALMQLLLTGIVRVKL